MRAAADSGAGRGPHWLDGSYNKVKISHKNALFLHEIKKKYWGVEGHRPTPTLPPSISAKFWMRRCNRVLSWLL